jgi:hypothetical protein
MPAITQEDWITISRLRLMLECTWYKLIRYQKLSVLPLPDMIVNGRGMWRAARFPAIKAAVDNYEEAIRQAERNELQTIARAEREAEEARQVRTQELGAMYQRRAEEVLGP